jgi:hypothetical protein
MSGDMCTSLGNGFTNYMLMLFVVTEKGGVLRGVFEGDDGLWTSDVPVSTADFGGLGFDLKLDRVGRPELGSFCGLVSSEDGVAVTNVKKVMMNFFWSHSPLARHAHLGKALLRAKAMSLLYEYPRCPITVAMARFALRQTEGVTPRFDTSWHARTLQHQVECGFAASLAAAELGVSPAARRLVSDLYGIDEDIQRDVEAMFDSDQVPAEWVHEQALFDQYPDCLDYCAKYVRPENAPKPVYLGAILFSAPQFDAVRRLRAAYPR